MSSTASAAGTSKSSDALKKSRGKSYLREFIVLRNNAIQRRRFRNDQLYGDEEDDRTKLLLQDDGDSSSSSPPSYVGQSEALQYQIGRLESKVQKLDALHKKHLARPTLDDDDAEARTIDETTKDITSLFSTCHRQLKTIQRSTSSTCQGLELIFTKNLVMALGNRLQEITDEFRKSQGEYLKTLKLREEKSKRYFQDFAADESDLDPSASSVELDIAWTKQDVLLLEDNTKFIQQREQEIQNIVDSIVELNSIFNDLAQMVSDQGTIVDRIDYNLENCQVKIEEGLQQLKKAAKYQKQDKKMHCIVILAVIVIFLLLILIIKIS